MRNDSQKKMLGQSLLRAASEGQSCDVTFVTSNGKVRLKQVFLGKKLTNFY